MSSYAESLRQVKYLDENARVKRLLSQPVYTRRIAETIGEVASNLVSATRDPKHSKPLLDTFLSEYGLSNSEGVALMCLTESLIRVPDWDTADLLIADKLGRADWEDHAGNADSLLVNASTWALMLTGRVVELDEELNEEPIGWLTKLISRISCSNCSSFRHGNSRKRVCARPDNKKALKRCNPDGAYSFDMLGETARDEATAQRYFRSYMDAIETVGKSTLLASPSVSIKLSALHPRYETVQESNVRRSCERDCARIPC